MKALMVPKGQGETLRKQLLKAGYVDTMRKLKVRGYDLEIPVTDTIPPEFSPFPCIQQEEPEYYENACALQDLMKMYLGEDELKLLPGGWQILGDVVIVALHPDLYPVRSTLGDVLLTMYPYCRSVYLNKGIEGELRLPNRELISMRDGVDAPALAIHTENGCRFKLDVTKVMFCKGNFNERTRMGNLGRGEVVVDMFAGIGYFTIQMAVHSRPARIIAIELNPESYQFLVENTRLNHVEDIVEPILGDCAKKTPVSVADRVVMGYAGNTHHYLPQAIRALKNGGVLHYHEIVPEKLMPDRSYERIHNKAREQGRKAEILNWHRVKKYSPGVWHVVVDARIDGG
ncbi:MAG: class I SAM-dependent methyltransferase family protein [Methanosarcinales archaeon]|nr:class I SAM-dependent methyltransferase family protein [Methanosarcinales archaeon]